MRGTCLLVGLAMAAPGVAAGQDDAGVSASRSAPHFYETRGFAGVMLLLGTLAGVGVHLRRTRTLRRRRLVLERRVAERTEELQAANEKLERASRAKDESLRETEARHRGVIREALDCIISMDASGNVVEFNPAAETTFGYTRNEVLGKQLADLIIPPDLREQHREGLARHLATGEVRILGRRMELEAMRADGTRVSVELTVARDDTLDEPLFTAFLRDVAEQRRAEQQLRRAATVLENMVDAVVVLDTDDRIVEMNASAERLFGCALGNVAGQSVTAILGIEDPTGLLTAISAEIHGERGKWSGDLDINPCGDDPHVCEVIVHALFDDDDEELGRIGVFRDVTERRRAEEARGKLEHQLRHAQKMETVGTLAAGIAHDFNNILVPIIGYTEMVRRRLRDDRTGHEQLGWVLDSARRASHLVGQILTFGRQSESVRGAVDLGAIVIEVGNLIRPSAPPDIRIDVQAQEDLPTVFADTTQIQQVVLNLATNAVQAMGDSGTLTLAVDTVEADDGFRNRHPTFRSETAVRVRVADTGSGMDPATASRIYEPFFTTKEIGEGTGLGLSVVHGIVTDHDGAIELASTQGVGTRFDVFLPSVTIDKHEAVEAAGEIPGGTERIMVVDDEEVVVRLMQDMLRSLGYRVEGFSSSRSAFEAFVADSDAYDLVVTDQSMPELSGFDLAAEILSQRSDLPVVMTTGFMRGLTRGLILERGLTGLLRKPFDIRSLAHEVRRALEHASHARGGLEQDSLRIDEKTTASDEIHI